MIINPLKILIFSKKLTCKSMIMIRARAKAKARVGGEEGNNHFIERLPKKRET
jgi:hypothetical protein